MFKKIKNIFLSTPKEIRASTAYLVCNILQRCLSFITMPLFTRILTQEQYGQYTVYTTWSAIFTIFLTLNMSAGSLSTAMVKYDKDREGYISTLQSITTILCGAFVLIYFPFSDFFGGYLNMSTPLVYLMVAEILAQFALTCWYTLKRFEYKAGGVVTVTLLISFSAPSIAYFLVINSENKGIARILGYALVNIIAGLIFYIYNMLKGKKILKKEYFVYALKFNIPIIPYYVSQVIFNQSDRIMIDNMCGTAEAGMYGVAYTLGIILTFVLNSINGAYVPWFYERLKDGRGERNKSVSNKIAILMAFMLLGIIALTPELINILAGKDYEPAIWCVPPIAMSVLLLLYSQYFINVEFYYEEKYALVVGSIASAVLNVVLNFILIPKFGFSAAAYTTLISYIVFAGANYFTCKFIMKKHKDSSDCFDIKALILILVVFMALSFAAMALYKLPLVRYAIIALVFIAITVKYKAVIAFVKSTMKIK